MYSELMDNISKAGVNKINHLNKSIFKYLIASILAGFFVGLGILLIFSISGQLGSQPYTKLIMGVSFGIALSLVIMAGSELFTGNNFVLGVTYLDKKARIIDVLKLWFVCYIGNLIGAAFVSFLFIQAGLGTAGEGLASDGVAMALQKTSALKMSQDFVPLFFKGILCNILVCLAVLCSLKLKSESGKLIMIWWCLFAFITSGYEHSIANMTIFISSLLTPHLDTINLNGMGWNLLATSTGNIVGGLLLAVGYYYTTQTKKGVK